MSHRILLCVATVTFAACAYSAEVPFDRPGENWNWGYGVEEGSGGSSYLGVDIADVTTERLGTLKLKEEHGAEVTMVDQDAPAGKAGLKDHDVILSLNGAAVESASKRIERTICCPSPRSRWSLALRTIPSKSLRDMRGVKSQRACASDLGVGASSVRRTASVRAMASLPWRARTHARLAT
jgi:hypothetical protein